MTVHIPTGHVVLLGADRRESSAWREEASTRPWPEHRDDGFTIGQVTPAGSYNLLPLGATIGTIGAAAYQWVRPGLLGPWWFRRLTTGANFAVVVGSMLLHVDGIDFNVLQPTWLEIGLFTVPGLFGVVIGPAVDRVGLPGSRSATGRRRPVVPIALIAMFPLVPVALSVAAPVVAPWLAIRLDSARDPDHRHHRRGHPDGNEDPEQPSPASILAVERRRTRRSSAG